MSAGVESSCTPPMASSSTRTRTTGSPKSTRRGDGEAQTQVEQPRRPSVSHGIDEVRLLVPMPEALATDATKRAADEGVSRAEWIRAAMRDRLDIRRQTETAIDAADDARAAEASALRR